MATLRPAPADFQAPSAAEAKRFQDSVAEAKRSRMLPAMSARTAQIMRELATPPAERTFTPVGWPKSDRGVLRHLRASDANWTWDTEKKELWVDGWTGTVTDYADAHQLTAEKPRALAAVRNSDPVTSRIAAAVRRDSLAFRVREVLEAHADGLTDWELTALLGEPERRKPSIAKRRQEAGAVDSGRTRPSPDGLPCIVWVAS